ncbi:MAG: TPM domain-containing protein [Kiritimatiellae bacterium]|nr:TPM domain-containing protein [Kiritimatiellia bacterium]
MGRCSPTGASDAAKEQRRAIFRFIVIACLFFAIPFCVQQCSRTSATAKKSVAFAEVPALTGRVVDTSHTLDAQGVEKIEQEILQLETALPGCQMAVLLVPTIGRETIEAFSMRVAEKWKIGDREKDRGAILTLAVKDHLIRLEIGYGWEGDIPDARAGDIIRSMRPYLQAGNYTDAICLAVQQVRAYVTKDADLIQYYDAKRKPQEDPEKDTAEEWVVIVFFILWFIAMYHRDGKGGGRSGPRFYGMGSFGGGSHFGGHFGGGGGHFGGGGASGRW